MQADVIVNAQRILHAKRWPQAGIVGIALGDDGVKPIVAAGELDND